MKKITKYIIGGLCVLVLVGAIYFFSLIAKDGFGPGSADYTYKIAGSCNLTRSSAHVVVIGCSGVGVPPEIIETGWNDSYLLAVNNPIKGYPNTYSDPDPSVKNWWIVDLKNKKAYGPMMTEYEFNQKKASLGITDIQLMPIEQAKTKGTWVNGDFKN